MTMMFDPILTVKCQEKDKEVEHSISLLEMTPENLKRFWDISKKFPTLFGQKVNEDFGQFCEVFVHKNAAGIVEGNGLVWVIDDFLGVFYMTDIYIPEDAMVHFSFFDGRIRGREPLVKEMLKYVFTRYGFNRLSAAIPLYALPKGWNNYAENGKSPTEFGFFKFVKNCGFKQEGRKRKSSFYKGEHFDSILYGILKEEVLNG